MGAPASKTPLNASIVLLGAGNTHLQILRRWAMSPLEGASLTLINDGFTVPYSGMIPGYLSGQYKRSQVEIDLVSLCGLAGARFVCGKAETLDSKLQHIHCDGVPPINYTFASINLGSRPLVPDLAFDEFIFPIKPLSKLTQRVSELESYLQANKPEDFQIHIVGGGAGGVEVCFAIHRRLSRFGVKINLHESGGRILNGYPASVANKIHSLLDERGILIFCDSRIKTVVGGEIVTEDGKALPCSAALWATRASPTPFVENCDLKKDKRGFILTKDTLQVVGHPNLFATGDCATLENHVDLAKAGVYAVRQGPTLWANLARSLHKRPLKRFKPQSTFLTILNTADGKALARWNALYFHSRLSMRLKTEIDTRWMKKFQELSTLSEKMLKAQGGVPMPCGGCGSKVPNYVLREGIKGLKPFSSDKVVAGLTDADDASLIKTANPERLAVHSVDYFRAFLPDPYLVGQIAALNAVSDLYAMNAKPEIAHAIVNLPYGKPEIQKYLLRDLLEGANKVFVDHEVSIVGGHTAEATELGIGFHVSGEGVPSQLFRKSGLQTGDKLILTKPLGSGALLAALMRGSCTASWFEKLIYWLLVSNAKASRVFAEHQVVSCTDVTGFGLAGHLLEMLDASQKSAQLQFDQIVKYKGFAQVTAQGIYSTLHAANLQFSSKVSLPGDLSALFDPQTSGGLLAAVPSEKAETILSQLKLEGYTFAKIIGTITDMKNTPEIN